MKHGQIFRGRLRNRELSTSPNPLISSTETSPDTRTSPTLSSVTHGAQRTDTPVLLRVTLVLVEADHDLLHTSTSTLRRRTSWTYSKTHRLVFDQVVGTVLKTLRSWTPGFRSKIQGTTLGTGGSLSKYYFTVVSWTVAECDLTQSMYKSRERKIRCEGVGLKFSLCTPTTNFEKYWKE